MDMDISMVLEYLLCVIVCCACPLLRIIGLSCMFVSTCTDVHHINNLKYLGFQNYILKCVKLHGKCLLFVSPLNACINLYSWLLLLLQAKRQPSRIYFLLRQVGRVIWDEHLFLWSPSSENLEVLTEEVGILDFKSRKKNCSGAAKKWARKAKLAEAPAGDCAVVNLSRAPQKWGTHLRAARPSSVYLGSRLKITEVRN